MSRIEKLHRFLEFWFSPWGAAKGERWEGFSNDLPFEEQSAEKICKEILQGTDHYNWKELG